MPTIKIPARPKLPVKNGKEPLVHCKLEVLKGYTALYLRSQTLEETLQAIVGTTSSIYVPQDRWAMQVHKPADVETNVPEYERDRFDVYSLEYQRPVIEAITRRSEQTEWETCYGMYYGAGNGAFYNNRINLAPFLVEGLGEGRTFLCRFPLTLKLAKDLVKGISGAAEELIASFPRAGSIESSVYAEANP